MTKLNTPIRLSARLQALADLVTQGMAVADVGCDHGFLDIYLVQSGKSPSALAMDVRTGPLAAAAEHIREYGLEDRIATRLSDGLEKYLIGEAGTLVCAGMGGPLMQRILTAYPEKTDSFEEMILQPQSEIREFRVFLRENGYRIIAEKILIEDGKYYFPMKVVRGLSRLEAAVDTRKAIADGEATDARWQEVTDRYGAGLIEQKDPLLKEYLLVQKRTYTSIRDGLTRQGCEEEQMPAAGDRRSQRLREVEMELEYLQMALERIG